MATEIDRLKAAYQTWADSKGARTDVWTDIVGDDFHLQSMSEQQTALEVTDIRAGPKSLAGYFDVLAKSWTMQFYEVDALFGEGDQIAMFGRCSWTSKQTGKTATTAIAHLWRFRDGKAVSCIEIFDSAKAVEASIPD